MSIKGNGKTLFVRKSCISVMGLLGNTKDFHYDNIKTIKNETVVQTESKEKDDGSRVEVVEKKKNDRIVNVLNYVIIFLVIVFICLCGMIGYQLFF